MLHIDDTLMFKNGTRQVPTDWKWWRPSSEYLIAKGRERVAKTSIGAGMAAGITIGFAVSAFVLFIVYVYKTIDGTF